MLRSVESFSLKRGTLSPVAGRDRYTDAYYDKAEQNAVEDLSALRHAAAFDAIHAEAMALPEVRRLLSLAGFERVSGRAELTVRDAATRLTPLRPVGSYRLTVEGGALPDLRLETLQGGLQLSGSGQWVGERLRFTGEARAQPGTEAALDNVLNIIGRRAGTRALISLG